MSEELRDQLQSSLGSAYTIERELGGGGMARVFVAEELALGRRVVIKVLPSDALAHVSADRFRREIAFAAQLQHPHVVPLLSAGDADGLLYYTMPFIDGDSLRARMAREGRLPLAEVVGILRDVARALEFAHARGVVHRDIKPENVLLAGNAAVVTDFGIAKAIDAAFGVSGPNPSGGGSGGVAAPTLTAIGISLGTPAYMAPEQVLGDPATDHRADLYAFGCMAYELLAGRLPFEATSTPAMLAAHVARPPTPLVEWRPDVPHALGDLVMRCLAKEPADRPQTAAELMTTLGAISPAAASMRERSPAVAVLPFADLGAGPGEDFLALAVSERIADSLSGVGGLRVIARSSTDRLVGTEKDARTIGRELDVEHLLDGSVRRTGNTLRLSAQLIDTRTDAPVWTDRFTGTVREAFDLQERVVRAVLGALRVRAREEDEARFARRPVESVRAFECFSRARLELGRRTPDAVERAERLVESALRAAGESALLSAALGHVLHARVVIGHGDDAVFGRAEQAAQRAVALDGELAYAHFVRGLVHTGRGELADGERSYARALELEPNDPDAMRALANLLLASGREADARPLHTRLVEIDPLTPGTQALAAWAVALEGDLEGALPLYERAADLDPASAEGAVLHAVALAWNRRTKEALRVLDAAAGPATAASALADALARALRGDSSGVAAAATPGLLSAARHSEWLARELMHAFAIAGDRTAALRWLDEAIRLGFRHQTFLAERDPLVKALRGTRDFAERVDRLRAGAPR